MPSKLDIYPLRLDPRLRSVIVERAAWAGMSVNAFIAFALAAFVYANSAQQLKRRVAMVPTVHHNKMCPCGSGERYRNCCRERLLRGDPTFATEPTKAK
jgi:hypothetical protein